MTEAIIDRMKAYFGSDTKRINHALSVLSYARKIMEAEACDRGIVEAASVLHDIGIHEAERKHHSTAGRYQEQEGPPIATGILQTLGYPETFIEPVCAIIAHHHTPGIIHTPEFQVLYEADWLVNLQDDFKDLPAEKKKTLIIKNFKTQRGLELAWGL